MTLRSTLTIPPLPPGATITGARINFRNLAVIDPASILNEIEITLGGLIVAANVQLTLTDNPTQSMVSFDIVGGLAGLAAGGNVTLSTADIANDPANDAQIGSADVTIYYTQTFPAWFTAASGGTPIATGGVFDPLPGSYVDPNVPGTTTFYVACSNTPCSGSPARTPVVFTVTAPPTTATVGSAQTICATGTTSGLGGNTETVGTGLWTVQSGGTGTFSDDGDPNSTFTHTGGAGPVVLRWTMSNAPCASSFAEVSITVNQPPTTATVGGPQTICENSTTLGLGGNTHLHACGRKRSCGGALDYQHGGTMHSIHCRCEHHHLAGAHRQCGGRRPERLQPAGQCHHGGERPNGWNRRLDAGERPGFGHDRWIPLRGPRPSPA
ncbi:MAG: hypothetical protein IPG92_09045 [Flavobacteriales bacterium]|nr:hypothetical protein [Flavobacteriales bacterium]